METKIILTPKQAAALTGKSVRECIIIGLQTKVGYDDKEINKLAKLPFELTEFIQFPANGSVVFEDGKCMLRSIAHCLDFSFQNFLMRIVGTKSCVDKLELTNEFKNFLPLLSPENRKKIYEKLAERHASKFGTKTKEYINYQNTK